MVTGQFAQGQFVYSFIIAIYDLARQSRHFYGTAHANLTRNN